jgi:hypothetical protein
VGFGLVIRRRTYVPAVRRREHLAAALGAVMGMLAVSLGVVVLLWLAR